MRRKQHLSGPFDWLKKLLPPTPPGPKSQLPAIRESMLPAQVEKPKTFLDYFKPKSEQEKGTLIPIPEFLNVIIPAPSPPKPARTEPEKEVWQGLFQPEKAPEKEVFEIFKPEAKPSLPEMFEFLKPSAKQEALLHTHPQEWPYGEPPLWSFTRWKMPTTYELALMINEKWELPEVWEVVLQAINTRWWKQQVEESSHTGEPAAIDINQITKAEPPYNDIARFLNIPDNVIEQYGIYGPQGEERLVVEVVQPILGRIGKALDFLRPSREMKGWFEIEPDENMNFWLRYKEAKFKQTG
jgi:hypothetical protein